MDSLTGTDRRQHVSRVKDYLMDKCTEMENHKTTQIRKRTVGNYRQQIQNVEIIELIPPEQKNSSDCGIYVIQNAIHFAEHNAFGYKTLNSTYAQKWYKTEDIEKVKQDENGNEFKQSRLDLYHEIKRFIRSRQIPLYPNNSHSRLNIGVYTTKPILRTALFKWGVVPAHDISFPVYIQNQSQIEQEEDEVDVVDYETLLYYINKLYEHHTPSELRDTPMLAKHKYVSDKFDLAYYIHGDPNGQNQSTLTVNDTAHVEYNSEHILEAGVELSFTSMRQTTQPTDTWNPESFMYSVLILFYSCIEQRVGKWLSVLQSELVKNSRLSSNDPYPMDYFELGFVDMFRFLPTNSYKVILQNIIMQNDPTKPGQCLDPTDTEEFAEWQKSFNPDTYVTFINSYIKVIAALYREAAKYKLLYMQMMLHTHTDTLNRKRNIWLSDTWRLNFQNTQQHRKVYNTEAEMEDHYRAILHSEHGFIRNNYPDPRQKLFLDLRMQTFGCLVYRDAYYLSIYDWSRFPKDWTASEQTTVRIGNVINDNLIEKMNLRIPQRGQKGLRAKELNTQREEKRNEINKNFIVKQDLNEAAKWTKDVVGRMSPTLLLDVVMRHYIDTRFKWMYGGCSYAFFLTHNNRSLHEQLQQALAQPWQLSRETVYKWPEENRILETWTSFNKQQNRLRGNSNTNNKPPSKALIARRNKTNAGASKQATSQSLLQSSSSSPQSIPQPETKIQSSPQSSSSDMNNAPRPNRTSIRWVETGLSFPELQQELVKVNNWEANIVVKALLAKFEDQTHKFVIRGPVK